MGTCEWVDVTSMRLAVVLACLSVAVLVAAGPEEVKADSKADPKADAKPDAKADKLESKVDSKADSKGSASIGDLSDPNLLFNMQGKWESGASKLQQAQYDVQIAFHRMNFAAQAKTVAQGRLYYANAVIFAAESVENTTKEYKESVAAYEKMAKDGSSEAEKTMKLALNKKREAEASFVKATGKVHASQMKAYTSQAAATGAGLYGGAYGAMTGVYGGYGAYGFAGLGGAHGMLGLPTAYWKNQEALSKAAREQWMAGQAANAAAYEAAAAGHMKGSSDVSAMEAAQEKNMIGMQFKTSDGQIEWAKKLKADSAEKLEQAEKAYSAAEVALKKAKANEKAAAAAMDAASAEFVKSGLAPLHTPYLGGARPMVSFHPAYNPNMFQPESAAMYAGRFRADPVLNPYGVTPDQFNFSPTAVMGLSAANSMISPSPL